MCSRGSDLGKIGKHPSTGKPLRFLPVPVLSPPPHQNAAGIYRVVPGAEPFRNFTIVQANSSIPTKSFYFYLFPDYSTNSVPAL